MAEDEQSDCQAGGQGSGRRLPRGVSGEEPLQGTSALRPPEKGSEATACARPFAAR